MKIIHLAPLPDKIYGRIKKALRGKFKVVEWDNTNLINNSPDDISNDVAIVDEHWAQQFLTETKHEISPSYVVFLSESSDAGPEGNLADRALKLLNEGAGECITADTNSKEIVGIIDHLSRNRPPKKVPRSRIFFSISLSIFLLLGFFFLLNPSQPQKAPPKKESLRLFHVLLPHPTGIAVEGDLVWISDWSLQQITSYRLKEDLKVLHVYKFKEYAPLALAASDEGLWSLSNDLAIRLHEWDQNLTVVKKFPIQEYRLAGLAWDGKDLWSCDIEQNNLVRIELGKKAVVKETIPFKTLTPIGIVAHENTLTVLAEESGELLTLRKVKSDWILDQRKTIPLFADGMNKPSGLGGTKNSYWVSAEKNGMILHWEKFDD